jgi:hypothetical protein
VGCMWSIGGIHDMVRPLRGGGCGGVVAGEVMGLHTLHSAHTHVTCMDTSCRVRNTHHA